jgi:archaellum biogenesis ATPase FlaH
MPRSWTKISGRTTALCPTGLRTGVTQTMVRPDRWMKGPVQTARSFGAGQDLWGPDQSAVDPETMMVVSLVRSGSFVPEEYGVTEQHIHSRTKEWGFCLDYQNICGHAPDEGLLRKRFPSIPQVPRVDPSWAAKEVLAHDSGRSLRSLAHDMLTAIKDGDYETGWSLITGHNAPKPAAHVIRPVGMAEAADAEQDAGPRLEVPWPYLQRTTGGMGRGQMWVVGGRLGDGKTYTVCNLAAHAALNGYRVGVMSREMTAKEYQCRIADIVLGPKEAQLRRQLRHGSRREVSEALNTAQNRLKGEVVVLDPSSGDGTVRDAESLCEDRDVVVVDHIGLVRPADKGRIRSEWTTVADISHSLKETALRRKVVVIVASQVNRDGDRDSDSPPKVSQLALSDSIGQDADVVLTLRKRGYVHSMRLAKNRFGETGHFWARFDPASSRFDEVDEEQAEILKVDESW